MLTIAILFVKQDYSKRAKDYNKKQAQLKQLRAKAADRNEDEFYFGMMSRKGPGARIKVGKSWNGTVEGDRGNKVLDVNTTRLLKTQDMGYIRTMKQIATKELTRLEEQIIMTRGIDRLDETANDEVDEDEFKHLDSDENEDESPAKREKARSNVARKILFFDNEMEQEDAMEEHLEHEEREAENEDEEGCQDEQKKEGQSDRGAALRRLQRQLENTRKKLKSLMDAEGALEAQRAKMAKTATSGGLTRRGKKITVRTRKR